jgi:hypothetical protein
MSGPIPRGGSKLPKREMNEPDNGMRPGSERSKKRRLRLLEKLQTELNKSKRLSSRQKQKKRPGKPTHASHLLLAAADTRAGGRKSKITTFVNTAVGL